MTPTMSSREIAELCGKQHFHVCRDIEVLNRAFSKLGLSPIPKSKYEQGGRSYTEYKLTREQTLDLVTGYNAAIRIRVNRRWLDLEQATANIAYHEDIRLQYARKEVLERLEKLDNAEQLLRQAEEARQEALADLGDLSEFDQRMIAKYGDKYPIRKKAQAQKLESMLMISPEKTAEAEIFEQLLEDLEYGLDN